ncbi:AlpA family phage regulatory protein [Neobacillus sp. MM2021_6]|uniref:AlpA family phage regulatory protein n=1 Tax=Bacillaceae TaxID=186817 RepID=UPI0014081224|nr:MULTISPECIES: AlpA family phage regulatory protein [Bacillaceae]MBO0961966.1 AlpA family phage regulatory protein [Neobacillus sp. MM2021_6]NHC20337.1 AlpA family phage regulatory protein [Bacillus sp. MM2020_4]
MRKVRGVKSVCDYLSSIQCPMSESTIFRLMRTNEVPFSRPAPRVVIFDLDEIDCWIGNASKEKQITN